MSYVRYLRELVADAESVLRVTADDCERRQILQVLIALRALLERPVR